MFDIDYTKTPVTDFYGINCFTEVEMGKYPATTSFES